MASRRSPLKAYAEHITCAVETVDSYCRENNLLDATVDSDQNISIHLPPSAPQNVLVARQTIIDSALKLQQLAVGPNEYLPYMAVQVRPKSVTIISHLVSAPFHRLSGSRNITRGVAL